MTELPQVGSKDRSPTVVRAKARDLSRGGMCVVSDEAIPLIGLVRCELALPGVPTPIPTMMQTRWSRTKNRDKCATGLQFLL